MTDAPKDRFTLIFDGDIIDFEGNPFHVDTPFGRPQVVSVGDLAQERDKFEEALHAQKALYAELLRAAADLLRTDGKEGSDYYDATEAIDARDRLQNAVMSLP